MATIQNTLSLVDVITLEGSDVGCRIVECLEFPDVQRCACVAKALAALPGKYPRVTALLKDLYLLSFWPCPSRPLRRKIIRAMQSRQYRIVEYESGGRDRPQQIRNNDGAPDDSQKMTLFQVLEDSWTIRFFGGTNEWSFASVHQLDLEERELERGEAYDDISGNEEDDDSSSSAAEDTDDDGNARNPKRQRREMLHCECKYCHDSTVSRVYYVHGVPYCGVCLDASTFLKLRWCVEHYNVDGTDWNIQEIDYDDSHNNPNFWGAQDGEFMARLWYTQPYNTGELRLIGRVLS